jgi:predicted ATP-dependent endonuclease of OLD family
VITAAAKIRHLNAGDSLMPLLSITIANYRGIGDQQVLEFARPDSKTAGSGLTVLVGPNNSGKSTVLRAISGMFSGDKEFVADSEDRRGDSFPHISVDFEVREEKKKIETTVIGKSAYLQKTGDLADADNWCRYVPARRPWRDRFNRHIGYQRENYERDVERNRRSDEFYVDLQFGAMLHEIERDEQSKAHYLSVLRYIEPSIIDFWVDRTHGQDFLAFESVSGFAHRAGIVGEGVQNIFRLCDALIHQKESEVLLGDEPELSLHPQSQRRLYKLLAQRAVDRQIVASTHSVHFVDWAHIRSGTKVYREPI